MVARSPSSSVFSSLISSSANRFRLIERMSFWYSSNNRWRNFCVFLSSICVLSCPPRTLVVSQPGYGSICVTIAVSTTQLLTNQIPEQVQHDERQRRNRVTL